MKGSVAVVLFTRDLRVHDHPGLHAASRAAERVVPTERPWPAPRTDRDPAHRPVPGQATTDTYGVCLLVVHALRPSGNEEGPVRHRARLGLLARSGPVPGLVRSSRNR